MRRAGLLACVWLMLGACGGGEGGLRIGVASSLNEVVRELTAAAGIEAEVSAAGTPSLVAQQREGAGFDVLFTADRVALTGLGGDLFPVATNRLVVATPTDNPGGVTGPADLARSELIVGLGALGVPVGDYARAALSEAGITPLPDSLEPSARGLVSKLERGELDAAVVYRTDVRGRNLRWIPVETSVVPEYWLVALSDEAAGLVSFIGSPEGRELLAQHGFGVAP